MNEKEKLTETAAAADTAEKKAKKPSNLKKLRFGSMSVIVIVLVIAIVIVLNLMAGILARRVNTEIDLTPDKRYELSDETIDAMKSLDKDVEITITCSKDEFEQYYTNYMIQMYYYYMGYILSSEDCPFEMIPKILERYETAAAQGSGSVTVKYVDMNSDPDVIAKYSKYYNGEIETRSMIVYSNERVKIIDASEIISMFQPDGSSTSSNISMTFAGESTITSAIQNVTDSHPISVAFIKNMNGATIYDSQMSGLVEALETFISKNGYDCEDIDIASDDLDPEKYDMAVLAIPSNDVTPDIVAKLSNFLNNDGKYERDMLYIPWMYAVDLPNLNEFLADWSIEVGNSIILDDKNMQQVLISAFGVYDNAMTVSISDEDSVGTLPNSSLPIVSPYTRPVNILTKNNMATATAVLQSSAASYLLSMEDGSYDTTTGARNVAVVSKKNTSEGFNVYESHLMVFGSSFFADAGILSYTNSYNNANVLLNMLNTMTGKEAAAVITEKTLQQSYIAPTQKQYNAVRAVTIYVIPLLVAGIGVFVLIRRKNR